MAASLSQPFDSIVIPSIEQGDPEPVRSSLALARTDYSRGEIREALRHLRRAAEDADEAGSEQRAVALARAAADLATAVGASQAPPPVTVKEPAAGFSSPPTSMLRSSEDPALRHLLETGRAVRVVVKRSTRDDELYVVRRAQDGAPPLGTREAVMVLLEPDDGFFKPTE